MSTAQQGNRSSFEPVWVGVIDVAGAIPNIPPTEGPDGVAYGKAASYVQWSGAPIGVALTDVPPSGLEPSAHAASIWDQLSAQLKARGAIEGIDLDDLSADGLGASISTIASGADAPHVTVIVATRDRPELLDRCLQSLLTMRYPSYDVLVVDNAPSSDATARLVAEKYQGEPVTRIQEDRPGLATAHNRGIREARGDILAFTDDDVIVDGHWLAALADAFRAAPDVGCVTGMIVPLQLDTQAQLWLEGYAGFSKGFQRAIYDLDRNRPDDRLFPYAAGKLGSGANMAFRADVLREIGGFDPALGAGSGAYGGDDLAAFFEVVTHGHTLVYEPGAMVRHEHPATEERLRRQLFGYGAGLTAYLTHTVVRRPSRVFGLMSRAPQAIRYALSSTSDRNIRQPVDFPRSLRMRELAGMAVGPAAYLRTLVRSRAADRRNGHTESS